MHPYLPHLLTDIAEAHRAEISVEPRTPLSFEEEMVEIEKWCEGEEHEHTFGYYCGLEAINFPPPEQFSGIEMKKVINAFRKMMYSWNHGIDMPETLPTAIAYKITVDTLNTKTTITESGIMNFDFCSGYAPDCIFKEYCPCLEFWNEEIDESDFTGETANENPF